MAEDSGQVVAITGHEGDRVVVSVPLSGFPQGFQLHPGDHIFQVQGEKGPEAWPLVRARELPGAPERKGHKLTAEGEEFTLQNSTVFFFYD